MKSIRFFFMFLVYIIVMSIYYFQSQSSLIQSAEKEVEQTLINHKALRKIVRKHYIPELKKLQETGLLDPTYSDPIFSSGTFLTQRLHDYTIAIQLETAEEASSFKYASLNPINPINKASKYEELIFNKMIQTNENKFSEIIEKDKKRYLLYATQFGNMAAMCLRCHGNPKNAPSNQVSTYGSTNGYNFKEGEPSSLVVIRLPLEEDYAEMNEDIFIISLIVFVIFLIIFLASDYSITRLKRQQEKVAKSKIIMNTDPLTGLLNRRSFEDTLKTELNRAKRDNKYLFFFFLDIDYFKQYNDTYGHQKGDDTLQAVADVLRECFTRSQESVYRLGGEEFGVITSSTNLEDVTSWSKNILYAVESMHIEHNKSPHNWVTVSLGIYVMSPQDKKIEIKDIINYADEALYVAKENGRNKASLYKAKVEN